MAPVWWRNLGTQFDISSIYAVSRGARFPPDEATVKGKDLLLKTDVGAAHILDANVGLGINYAVMAWHWAMVLVFMVIYFGIAALTTPMHEGIPWLTLVQKLLVFWNMWEALGLGVLSGTNACQSESTISRLVVSMDRWHHEVQCPLPSLSAKSQKLFGCARGGCLDVHADDSRACVPGSYSCTDVAVDGLSEPCLPVLLDAHDGSRCS